MEGDARDTTADPALGPRADRRLKEYANAYDTSLQQILEEAVDMWLASKNEPAFYPEGWSDDIGKKDIIE
jgi:hypothetical protein